MSKKTIKQHPILRAKLSKISLRSCPTSPTVRKSYRLVVAGSSMTGKTCLVQRFITGEFEQRYNPTIENFHRQFYKYKHELYQLDIFDTAGHDPFPAARRLSFISGDMFVLVCSVDVPESVNEVFELWNEIVACRDADQAKHPPIVIALNKVDLPPSKHQVSIGAVHDRASKIPNCHVIDCSAAEEKCVTEVFDKLFAIVHLPKNVASQIHRRLQHAHSQPSEAMPSTSHDDNQNGHESLEMKMSTCSINSVKRPSLAEELRIAHAKINTGHYKLAAMNPSKNMDRLLIDDLTPPPKELEPDNKTDENEQTAKKSNRFTRALKKRGCCVV